MVIRLVPGPIGDEPPHRPRPTDQAASGARRTGPDAGDGIWDEDDDLGDWLRGLVWTLGPVAPAISVRSSRAIRLTGEPGGIADGACRVANRERAAATVVLRPSPLRNEEGYVWVPVMTSPAAAVVPAGEERAVTISLFVPADLPVGQYRGTIDTLATFGDAPLLEVEIRDDP